MTATAGIGRVGGASSGAKAPFPVNHPWDRNAFLAVAILAWVGILGGFVPEMIAHVQSHATPYPLIVHFHAAAFVGWLTLFTVQILLIRASRRPLHRKLGYAMIGLAAAMAGLGPATALIVAHAAIGTPGADPGFLSIQFTDITAFVVLTGAAVLLRNQAAAHKRLILLGTLYITDAGFARIALAMHPAITGPVSFWRVLYLGPAILIVAMGVYDLITRRRLHPAYVAGFAWVALMQASAIGLHGLPAWQAMAAKIIATV